MEWKPGKEMVVPNALSQAVLNDPPLEGEFDDHAEINVLSQLPMTQSKPVEFQNETEKDDTLQILKETVMQVWSKDRQCVPREIMPLNNLRDEIVYCDGLLFKGNQIIVPKSLQHDMLERIHESHKGIVKSKRRARAVLFWPGMASQVEDMVSYP